MFINYTTHSQRTFFYLSFHRFSIIIFDFAPTYNLSLQTIPFFWKIYLKIMNLCSLFLEFFDYIIISIYCSMSLYQSMSWYHFYVQVPFLLLLFIASFSRGLSTFAFPGSEWGKMASRIISFFIFQNQGKEVGFTTVHILIINCNYQ